VVVVAAVELLPSAVRDGYSLWLKGETLVPLVYAMPHQTQNFFDDLH
jgi:hypothetical protein